VLAPGVTERWRELARAHAYSGSANDANPIRAMPTQSCDASPNWAAPKIPRRSSARSVFECAFPIANFEAVAAVDRLDVEDVFGGKSQHALHWRRDVLVHSVRKLNHHDRALARRAHQSTTDSPGTTAKLSEHDLHGN